MKILLIISLFLSFQAFGKSSQEERATKNIELTFQFGFDYRMNHEQIGAMYFLDANNLLGFKVGSSNEDSEQQTSIAFQYKHYISNSFYLGTEVFYLNSLEDDNWLANIFTADKEYARFSSMGAGLRIGNQWTWNWFTLGCDWVGVGHRIGVFRKDTSDSTKTTFTFLNVIAGISF